VLSVLSRPAIGSDLGSGGDRRALHKHSQQRCELGPHLPPVNDQVNSAVLNQKFGTLEALWQGFTHSLFDDARTGETNQCLGLSNVNVTEHGETRPKTAIGRFPGDAVSGEFITTESGLMYYDIKVGDGAQPSPTSTVTIHYTGWLTDGSKFQSSHDSPGDKPVTYPLNKFIPGWSEGVGGMKIGGKRKLIIPGNLAYVNRPPPGSGIPPHAMLIFDVELIAIPHDPNDGQDHSGHNH
jgi:FKBP-type peptidyl-prolyl cis-trans isomerase FkpA